MSYSVALSELDARSTSRAGGKAANLGELIRAGLPVPEGFCVTTDAYARIAVTAELDRVLTALEATPGDDLPRLRELATDARAAIARTPLPAEITAAIAKAYAGLGDDAAVAVRSSATAEDLPQASFAGQHDTYLNVRGADAVLDAVRRCWASLWTDRAVHYRANNAIAHRGVLLAVVVQHMVDAALAGVLFTADPVSGRRRRAVIDAAPGLGEALVSGQVNPDHFVVDSINGAMVERRLAPDRDVAILSDAQVGALASLGGRVEAHFGTPQDIEWAIDGRGEMWLTQARPITALFPLPPDAPEDPNDLRVYLSFNVAQGVLQPFTPMGIQMFRLMASGVAAVFAPGRAAPRSDPRFFAVAAQRVFLDVTPLLRSPLGRDRKSTRLNSSHSRASRMPSSA